MADGRRLEMAAVVTTIRDRCKRCYTCIRNCPAKAIKVEDGQAKVMEERCIACGNCYKVCAQSAKMIESGVEAVQEMLDGDEPVLAALAPSFPAAFNDCTPGQLVTALRMLGFQEVLEVAVGAEMVGREYTRLIGEMGNGTLISTPCPAVVSFIEKYYPSLLPYLAPIVSPIVALGRAVKEVYRPGARLVFLGPCVAKKHEIRDEAVAGAVDAAVTFRGLRRLLVAADIDPSTLPESEPDGPRAHVGGSFALPGGLLKTAALRTDVLQTDILVAEGKDNILHLIRELSEGRLSVRFLDLLFCDGCIDGPVMETDRGLFARRQAVADYVNNHMRTCPGDGLEQALERFSGVDLRRSFHDRSLHLPIPSEEDITSILRGIRKSRKEEELNCGACGYNTCREKAVAVFQGLAEPQMCLPYLVDQLQENLAQLEKFQRELADTQDQLIQSEKLASMGQLAAGVAHEINNPLGTITIYAHMLMRAMRRDDPRWEDLEMIVDEASRCRTVVAGLLEFARQGKLEIEPTDLNALLRDTIAEVDRQPSFARVAVVNLLDDSLPTVPVDPDQIRQVMRNLVVNAAEAMPDGGALTLSSGVLHDDHAVWVSISDSGCGIPEENLDRLFTPFFTTKGLGKGTGLGLSIAYGIVKMHRGTIEVRSAPGTGSTFTIILPCNGRPVPQSAREIAKERWLDAGRGGRVSQQHREQAGS
jgi:two-component system, NtrC family, sensor kinase